MTHPSMAHIFLDRVQATPGRTAFEHRTGSPKRWAAVSWAETGQQVRAIACGLQALGVAKGDHCAILSQTRLEWILIDLGIVCAGAATTTIYASNPASECAYILGHSEAGVCFVEDKAQLAKLAATIDQLPALEQIIITDPPDNGDEQVQTSLATIAACPDRVKPVEVLSLAELMSKGKTWDSQHPDAFAARVDEITPDDLATLIYTSGTTGPPKGVMLLHECWLYQAESIEQRMRQHMEPDDKQYVFLPLAHAYAKVLELVGISFGAITVIEGDIDYFLQGVQESKPSLIPAVPRVFEKAYNRILKRAKAAGGWKYRLFQWSVKVGSDVVALKMEGQEPQGWLALQYKIADRLVYKRLRAAFGGKVRAFVSGGAPLSPAIAAFFFAAGMPILEGYGMTETAAVATTNGVDAFRLGTVGLPGQGTQIKLADDGEILVKSKGLMKGYFKMPEATAAAFRDGWLHTGDIGTIDDDGFVRITGRKKDLIITAGGKNIAPQKVENAIKAASPYISQVVMHGDTRPYCVALVTCDEEHVNAWAAEQGIPAMDYDTLVAHPRVKALVWDAVAQVNRSLASFETIKAIELLPRELTIDDGEITPSMKVKRRVVESRYKELLDQMYAQASKSNHEDTRR